MATGFALNYDEPIPTVVDRLKREHESIDSTLRRIQELSREGSLQDTIRLLIRIKRRLLRHAVEEEARLMQVIMSEVEQESDQSIGIMRFHRNLTDFMNHTLPDLKDLPEATARREVRVFVAELLKHHSEEEELTFPLALKAESLRIKREGGAVTKRRNKQILHSGKGSLKIPDSMVEEHQEIFSRLAKVASQGDETGRAVGRLLSVLHPHFEIEDELAMPLLGALLPLSTGQSGIDLIKVIDLGEELQQKLPSMRSEHKKIGALIRMARKQATIAKDAKAISILKVLEHHAKIEEEVLYPAAIVAGKAAKALTQSN